jgi:hypothetical protein
MTANELQICEGGIAHRQKFAQMLVAAFANVLLYEALTNKLTDE